MTFQELPIGARFRFGARRLDDEPTEFESMVCTKVSSISYTDREGDQWKAGPNALVKPDA